MNRRRSGRSSRSSRPLPHGNRACSFRWTGPLHCFDHQEPAGDGTDQQAGRLGILYCGFSLSCCLVECFGDTGLIEAEGRQVALFETTRLIKLLDLQGNGAMRAGTVVAISGAADRQLSQKWSRYFYNCYHDIDGLIYTNYMPLAAGWAGALSSPVHLRERSA